MTELERRLTRLGEELDWPATPDLPAAVRRQLAAPARRPRFPAAGFRRSFVIALLALLVLAGGVFAAVPSVRDSVLEFFGLQGATVERRERLPDVPDLGSLRLGERTTLADARGELGFEPLVPRAAGRPDAVFVNRDTPGGELLLTYRAREGLPEARSTGLGLLVSEFRGDLAPEYTGKIAGQATLVEELRVEGDRAVWLEGAPHFFFYRTPERSIVEDELRVAQNVLLVERGRLLVRLEGAFGRAEAIRIARSLR